MPWLKSAYEVFLGPSSIDPFHPIFHRRITDLPITAIMPLAATSLTPQGPPRSPTYVVKPESNHLSLWPCLTEALAKTCVLTPSGNIGHLHGPSPRGFKYPKIEVPALQTIPLLVFRTSNLAGYLDRLVSVPNLTSDP